VDREKKKRARSQELLEVDEAGNICGKQRKIKIKKKKALGLSAALRHIKVQGKQIPAEDR